ncbi:hypothetical protein L6164_004422 [Bauhinia variegata]|uniref:Uncharacterized protein n=1 Tax=Bauhinia variegata TaxID=167791 RepID=A0ACB9Q5W3_BAUVA|nr:hypothetical protein L6164_004422 [Bauhinia variegata]
MATSVVEDVEYESDPEEAKRSLAMRRREASDDEEGEGDGRDKRVDRRVGIHSDESDGQGGVAEYDDEEEPDGEDEEVEEDDDEEAEIDKGDEVGEEVYEIDGEEGVHGADAGVDGSVVLVKGSDGDVMTPLEDSVELNSGNRVDEEKKENEPFTVPTAGAFYMHDDRFRENAGGRHRRTHGGRRLWESKDDRKWGHDKFEEMTLQERHHGEVGRASKGSYRGRGKSRGMPQGYARGNRKGYNNNNGAQSQVPKGGVRGRGSRRYEPASKRKDPAPQVQNKQSGKPLEKATHGSSERSFTLTPNAESDPVLGRKLVRSSNLNSASPPFYPSGSSDKDINQAPKRDVQAGSNGKNVHPGITEEGFSVQPNNAVLRGKNVVESISMQKLYIDESISPAVGKPLNNLQMPSSRVNASHSSLPRASGRGVSVPPQMNYRPIPTHNQLNKVSAVQLQAIQKSSVPSRTPPTSVQAPARQLGQRPASGSQASSPPGTTSTAQNSFDSGEMDAASEAGKSKGALVGKGRGGAQGNGRGSFLYGGAQVMGAAGNIAVSHGDQNFPGTPAFLPVMQFGGQHPGGIGVPAVGMAFPGYVAQPQLGLGNSEMTWLPVLAGAAGALGASYCSPYLAVDGSYCARQSGQTSAMGTSSKENNTNKSNSEWKPPQSPELVSDEFGQRQNKPRRYSEMNFGQFFSYTTPARAAVHLRSYCSLTGSSCLSNCAVFLLVWFFSEACEKSVQASLEIWILEKIEDYCAAAD